MTIAIASSRVEAEVVLAGGIVWRPRFRRGNGRWATPLAEAPWADDAAVQADPSHLAYIRKLGGAFLGLPFGGRAVPSGIAGWAAAAGDEPLHGLGATALWSIEAQRPTGVTIALEFPQTAAIVRVVQAIDCPADAARIDVTVTIEARRTGSVPIGYHPILRLPDQIGDLELVAGFGAGYSRPTARAPHDIVARSIRFETLARVPSASGGIIDLTRLPVGRVADDNFLLCRVAGPIVARYHDEGYDLVLDWDRAALPNCLLWYHDRGIAAPPWQGRFRGLGLEPGASAFDLSWATSSGANPLVAGGETTALRLEKGPATVLNFSLAVEEAP